MLCWLFVLVLWATKWPRDTWPPQSAPPGSAIAVVNVIVIGGDKESMCHANAAIHTSLIETAGGGCYSS